MKIYNKILGLAFFYGFLPTLQAQNVGIPEFRLDATQAKGGELIKTDEGLSAVLFPSAAPVNDKISWVIDGFLPAGLWQVEMEFYQPDGAFSPNQVISFEAEKGEKLAQLDLYYIGFTKGKFTRSFGLYSDKVISALSLIKNGQRNLNTVSVRSIRIFPATAASLEKLQFVFHLSGDGRQVSLPIPLLSGIYIGNTPKPVVLTWHLPDGRCFSTPMANEHRVFLDRFAMPLTVSGDPLNDIQLTRFPVSAGPDMSSAGDLPLIVAMDSTKKEKRSLTLIGYKGKETPRLDLFPYAKTMAVVTSWDDGQEKDIQLMETLLKYKMKGTFFMNRNSSMIPRLRELEANGMEVGSHSWSHPAFYNSSPKRCVDEAVEMRRFLEKEVNHPVISFAYPFNYQPAYDMDGNYVLRSIRQAGYWSARATTTGENRIDSISEPLAMRPDFHFKVGAIQTRERLEELLRKPGSILYIWGHSYELAGEGQGTLEAVLATVANRPEIWYATLGELMTWQNIRTNLKIESSSKNTGGKDLILEMSWLHPSLRQFPLSFTVPEGIKEVLWQGKKIPVINGHIQLPW